MHFYKARIKKDIESISVPIDGRLNNLSYFFDLEINTAIYKGKYHFRIDFTKEYPFKSPKVFCLSNVFHPNIYEGVVCLNVLREGWRPCFDINSIVVSIICIFECISGEEALNTEAGDLFETDIEEFTSRARSYELNK